MQATPGATAAALPELMQATPGATAAALPERRQATPGATAAALPKLMQATPGGRRPVGPERRQTTPATAAALPELSGREDRYGPRVSSATGVSAAVSAGEDTGRSGWAVVVAYATVVASTQMLWLTFAPIDTDVARDFAVSKTTVGWLAQVFPLLYVLLALPAGIALDRWFRGSLLVGASLTALGALLRLVSATFLWALIGQVVVAVAQPLVLNALTKTSTGYLARDQRPAGIAVGSASQFLGALVALVMGPLLERSHSLGPLLPVQAAIACLATLSLAAGLRRPPSAVGPPASIGLAEARAVWAASLIRRFALLAFVGIGVFVALSTWLQPILHRDRISSTAAGVMLAGMLISGTAGCAVVPTRVARRQAERAYLTRAVWLVAGCCAGLAVLHRVIVADFVLIAALGFVLLAALPVILQLTERRMGARGGVATGILLLVGNAGGLLVAVVVGLLVNLPVVAFLVLAAVILLGYRATRRIPRHWGDQDSRSESPWSRSEGTVS